MLIPGAERFWEPASWRAHPFPQAQTAAVSSTEPIDVRKFGATGKRADNATKAFRHALDAATARGGGVVNVPPGEYTVGTLQLKDNITLNIEAGATLFLSQLKEDYMEGHTHHDLC
jgi:polygalacturonase